MVEKVSTRSGNNKTKPQKYKNSFAFQHNKNSKTTKKILATPIAGVCQKCADIIKWRKDFRKYKPLTAPKKCVSCEQKKVKEAYHVMCNDCAVTKKVCAKCLEGKETIKKENAGIEENIEEKLSLLNIRERERRTILRKLQRGEQLEIPNIESDFSDDLSVDSDILSDDLTDDDFSDSE
jgi:hypothetical protein